MYGIQIGEREALRKKHLPNRRCKKRDVKYAFIMWSVPTKMSFKVEGHDGLKTFASLFYVQMLAIDLKLSY